MSARPLLALLAASVAAACGDRRPPTDPAPDEARPAVAAAACTRTKTYYLAEITRDIALTQIVNGALGPTRSTDRASMIYEYTLTATSEDEMETALANGCPVELHIQTSGYTSTLGRARAEYGGTVVAKSIDQVVGDITIGQFAEEWSQAPLPPDCNHPFNCLIPYDHVIPVSQALQATLHDGDRINVTGTGIAFTRAVGTALIDQGHAGWAMPRGSGLNPYGPRLKISLP